MLHDNVELITLQNVAEVLHNVVLPEELQFFNLIKLAFRDRINLDLFNSPNLFVAEFLSDPDHTPKRSIGYFAQLLVIIPQAPFRNCGEELLLIWMHRVYYIYQ